jgi:hypothetical protein
MISWASSRAINSEVLGLRRHSNLARGEAPSCKFVGSTEVDHRIVRQTGGQRPRSVEGVEDLELGELPEGAAQLGQDLVRVRAQSGGRTAQDRAGVPGPYPQGDVADIAPRRVGPLSEVA